MITSNLAAVRRERDISVSTLAALVKVSRQTIYAIEAGTYIPNTAVGLRLASTLGVAVEDLFSLQKPVHSTRSRLKNVTLLPSVEELQPGQPVQLCDVDGRLVAAPSIPGPWYLAPSDATVSSRSRVRGKVKVEMDESELENKNRLLLAGCDPAMAILARHLKEAGVDAVLMHQNSSQSLALLKRGCVHIAGTHLRDEASGESNLAAVAKIFAAKSVSIVSFARSNEGFVTASGNPKEIKTVDDLTRKDVRLINRESGSGSRVLLDNKLKRFNIDERRIDGYLRTAPGHLAAAWEVKQGTADCCMATQACARAFGLHFIPLESVRFDLVVRKKHLNLPGVQTLFDLVNRSNFRLKLKNAGGYDTSVTGRRIQ